MKSVNSLVRTGRRATSGTARLATGRGKGALRAARESGLGKKAGGSAALSELARFGRAKGKRRTRRTKGKGKRK